MTALMNISHEHSLGSTRQGLKIRLAPVLCAAIVLFSPWATYLQFMPFLTPVTLFVSLLASLVFLRFLRRPTLLIERQEIYLLLYICLVTASYFWTQSHGNWWNYIFWWYVCAATYFSARSSPRTAADVRLVLFAFFFGMVITIYNLELTFDEWGNASMRFSVFSHNPNFTAYVFSGGLFLFLVTWVRLGATPAMVFLFPFWIVLTFYALILLGTRGAIFSSALTLIIFFLRSIIPLFVLKMIIVSMFAISLSFSAGLVDFIVPFIESLFASRGTGDLSGRHAIWAEAYTYIFSNPLLGIGAGAFSELSDLQVGAHNIVLSILLESGVVGIFLFGGFIYYFLRGIYQKAKARREGLFLIALFCCFWLPIVSSGHWELAPFSWLLLAFFERLVAIERDGKGVKVRMGTRKR